MTKPKTSAYVYAGNPGYLFLVGDEGRVLNPGDKVQLTADEAEQYGADFTPAKGTTAAAAADPSEDQP